MSLISSCASAPYCIWILWFGFCLFMYTWPMSKKCLLIKFIQNYRIIRWGGGDISPSEVRATSCLQNLQDKCKITISRLIILKSLILDFYLKIWVKNMKNFVKILGCTVRNSIYVENQIMLKIISRFMKFVCKLFNILRKNMRKYAKKHEVSFWFSIGLSSTIKECGVVWQILNSRV